MIEEHKYNNYLFISIKEDGIYLNDTKIIDKKATQQIIIFKELLKAHNKAILECQPKNGKNWSELAAKLEKHSKHTVQEGQIRQLIYFIRMNIKKSLKKNYEEIIYASEKQYFLDKRVVLSNPLKEQN